nr:tetratricopeptide repeat protein [Thermoplasmata archaeon]NIS12370.1 tetratricopeptide repeat protein [Thermoplasmata archaeon]NIS20292.1 tetratricopeptide repeat protein [Thermoplasmata archaeon]NIT77636.1 tetratricopeptide repeat protein [Thermoplasmata archaeon]NIU49384.1 tetratricopeptide repeat protein [Thermoplasmata archaeon]
SYAKAWFNKGSALYVLGRYQEALACFDQVLELEPGYKKAIKNRNASIKKLEEIQRSFAEEPAAPGTTVAEEGQDWSAQAQFEDFAEVPSDETGSFEAVPDQEIMYR